MKDSKNKFLYQQFGAAIEMLGNAIEHCPENIWNKKMTSRIFGTLQN